ncbi:hypothetical protein J0H58_31285 [bacterium]|nr:hypothetical protein [bacterium]
MSNAPWAWDARQHPNAAGVFAEQTDDGKWCDRLETAATDLVVGKVVCVCAAAAIAREVLAAQPGADPAARDALELVEQWVDDPNADRFDRISETIFAGKRLGQPDAHGVVWFALRTGTSTADGYREAAWALASTCAAATRAGLTPERVQAAGQRGVMARVAPTG